MKHNLNDASPIELDSQAVTSCGDLLANTWASPACSGHPPPGAGRCHQSHLGTWCQAGGGRGVEVRACSTALTSSALESRPAPHSLQGCSQVLLGHTGGISCFKNSIRVSIWWQQGTFNPAARKHSCRAATGSVPSQFVSAAELILGQVFLFSLRLNNHLHFQIISILEN